MSDHRVGMLLGSVNMDDYWYCLGAGKQHNESPKNGKADFVKAHKKMKKDKKDKEDKEKKHG